MFDIVFFFSWLIMWRKSILYFPGVNRRQNFSKRWIYLFVFTSFWSKETSPCQPVVATYHLLTQFTSNSASAHPTQLNSTVPAAFVTMETGWPVSVDTIEKRINGPNPRYFTIFSFSLSVIIPSEVRGSKDERKHHLQSLVWPLTCSISLWESEEWCGNEYVCVTGTIAQWTNA